MAEPLTYHPGSLFSSLAEAQEWLKEAAAQKGGAICPCCSRFDKVYRRAVTRSMVKDLTRLYRLSRLFNQKFFHCSQFDHGRSVGKLIFIGLVRRGDNDDDAKQTSGHYQITEAGNAFVEGHLAIPRRLVFYHDELMSVSPETAVIGEFWPEFDYGELMGRGRYE